MHIKDSNVKNPKNVLVQVPGFVVNKWGLTKDDKLGVHYDDKTGCIIIRPKKVCSGSDANTEGEGLARSTTRHPFLQSV